MNRDSAREAPLLPVQADFTFAFVSSQGVAAPGVGDAVVLPTHPGFALTGLSAPSSIRAAKLVTLNRALISRWVGRLGPLLTADLDRALVAALGISTVPNREEGRQDERRRLALLHGAGGMASVLADLGLPTA